jgi:hypothetical protein
VGKEFAMVRIFLMIAVLAGTVLNSSVHAGDPNGRYAGLAVKQWLHSLRSGKGPCCPATDGVALADVGWESRNGHYRVRVEGAWWQVPDDAIITEPNLAGRAMVWPIYNWGLDGLERVEVQCFIPGGMT